MRNEGVTQSLDKLAYGAPTDHETRHARRPVINPEERTRGSGARCWKCHHAMSFEFSLRNGGRCGVCLMNAREAIR